MKTTIFLGFLILISSSEILRAQHNEWEVFTSENPTLTTISNTNTRQFVICSDNATTFVMQPIGKGPMTFWRNSQLVSARVDDSIRFWAKSFGFKFGVAIGLHTYTDGILSSSSPVFVIPDFGWADPVWQEICIASPKLGKMDNLIIQFFYQDYDSSALDLMCIQDIFTVMMRPFSIGHLTSWQPLFQDETIVPKRLILSQNYPNPFNPTTTIEFSLPSLTFVTLRIINALGQEIEKIVAKDLTAGFHRFSWNASQFPSGVYFCHLSTNTCSETRKMLLVK